MKRIEYINEDGVILAYRHVDQIIDRHYNFIVMFDYYHDLVVDDFEFNEYLEYLRQYNKLIFNVHGTNERFPG